MTSGDEQLVETLRLARDLCIGIGAFYVSPAGRVAFALSPVVTIPDVGNRIEVLAQSCLSHPEARGRELFWNAEMTDEGQSPDDSLACVAVPLRVNREWLGLVGVVDTWLPELDDEQRTGLLRLSQGLARRLAAEPDAAEPTQRVGARSSTAAVARPAGPAGPAYREPGPSGYPALRGDAVPEPPSPDDAAPGPGGWNAIARGPAPRTGVSRGNADDVGAGEVSWDRFDDAGGTGGEERAGEGSGFLGEVADNLPDGLVVAREDGTIIFANGTLAAMSGLAPDEILGSDIGALLAPDEDRLSPAETELDFTEFLLGTRPPGRRLQLMSTTGEELDVDVSGSRVDSSSVGECFVALLRDARRPVAGAGGGLSTDPSLGSLLDALDEGIVVCDAGGLVVVANRASRELQGLPADDDMAGHPFPASTALCTSDGSPLTLAHHPLSRALHGTVVRSEQLLLGSDEGTRRHIVASARPFDLQGSTGALLVLRDVTTQLQEEAWLTHLALHDPLTGLANRYLLLDYLRRMLGEFRSRGGAVALVFLDLDEFKGINDQFGHDVGDEVLIAVSRRVQGTVRTGDIVARLGGDEFVVAHTAADASEVELVVARIRKSLTAPYQVQGQTLSVAASIGWVVADPRHEDPTTLLVRADREMYRRKSARNRPGEATP
ncbi:MAG TPA: diguanylate cyclase [Acidimicrobiales bacterium]|nr:diguanylate cyclase [Acidimicrobiales bacterium]